jgi:cysteine desulfurase family protein (TIGR01976 family)
MSGVGSQEIREQFPALGRMVGGRPVAFFDGPAGSQVPRMVIDAVSGYLSYHNANTHGTFATSRETDETIERARLRIAAFLGARSPGEVVFGANMTTLTFALSRALRLDWSPGDEVIVTELDHQANVAPWRRAAEDAGALVRTVGFDPRSCTLDMAQLEGFIGPRTRLVAVGYSSNAVGTVNDVRRVANLAREAGALSFVDAVHFAPHGVIDVEEIGCDFLACSAYKFFGPHLGILWGRRELLESGRPYKVPPASDAAPDRWETGTLSHEGIAGAAAAVEWIASLAADQTAAWRERIVAGMETIEAMERPLLDRLVNGLGAIPGVRLYGPPAGVARAPTVALTVAGRSPLDVAGRLGEEGIFVWAGDFYATTVIDRLGLRESGGVVRIGLAPYNTAEEVDRLLDALARVARSGRS